MEKFIYGDQRTIEKLNAMVDAFNAGPYGAVPLIGGAMTGALRNAVGLFAGPDSTAPYASGALLAIHNTPTPAAGEKREVARLPVRGIPGAAFDGIWGVFTSAGNSRGNPYTGTGFSLEFWANDSNTGIQSAPALRLFGNGDATLRGSLQGGSVFPDVDNVRTLGDPSIAYATIYARTGTINTSDARLKCQFRDLTPAEIAAARDLARAVQVYRWRDAVEEKAGEAREHVGPTVQRAIEIMQAHGLDPFSYGFICYDQWEARTVEHPAVEARPAVPAAGGMPAIPAVEARAAYTETIPAGDRYAFRYAELSMFIAAGQAAYQDQLEQRLAALEAA